MEPDTRRGERRTGERDKSVGGLVEAEEQNDQQAH